MGLVVGLVVGLMVGLVSDFFYRFGGWRFLMGLVGIGFFGILLVRVIFTGVLIRSAQGFISGFENYNL